MKGKLGENLFLGRKFELIVPVFFGCLGSLIITASLMIQPHTREDKIFSHHEAVIAEEDYVIKGDIYFFTQGRPERQDRVLELYRDPQSQRWVFEFFTEICNSAEIAEVILYNASLFDIPPALAVALAWEESCLNPNAVNNKNRNESIDRGLFQLNDRSFPRLETQAFFSPETNAWYAMNHLRFCLDTGGTEVTALAMYNAGASRVRGAGTPKTTLDYISRILENRWEIETRFRDWEARFPEPPLEIIEDFTELAGAKPERPRLVPLMPLSGK
jgi:hypothetical protein